MKTILIILVLALLAGCGPKAKYSNEQIQQFKQEFAQHISEKDTDFKTHEFSPIKNEERADFSGLHYFEYNPELRFEGPLNKYDNPDTIIIYGSKGDERPSLKYAAFDFEYQDKNYSLQVFKILRSKPGYEDYLFLGFTDRTTNNETYGAGRYIDMVENESNHYVVDFNYAYNPYCAYNEKFSCAVPVAENDLPVRITAGEKKYHE